VVDRLFRVALLVQLASVLLAVWGIATFDGLVVADPTEATDAVADYDTLKRASMITGLVVEGAAGLALGAWLYRAHRSERVHPDWTEHWAGWAFLGWVPPFCFFMPYGIVRDLRRGAEGTHETRWPALGWWLTTLWLGVFVSFVAGALYAQASGPVRTARTIVDSYASGAWADLVSGLLLCCSLVLLQRVVATVRRVVTDSPFRADPVGPPVPA
jgi:hypothetical protein